MSNVIFLDYDGVVNTPMWNETGTKCRYNFPEDDKVNNYQAVQWISEFCQKYHYDIVVTSTWRTSANYKECLFNGGLRAGINILGSTPCLVKTNPYLTRGDEIQQYIDEHPDIDHYIIIDDEDDILPHQRKYFVQPSHYSGFGWVDFQSCKRIHNAYIGDEA